MSKVIFNEKQMMRDSFDAIAKAAKEMYYAYIETGTIKPDMDPCKVYPIIAQAAADMVDVMADNISEKEARKRRDVLTDKYTKLDIDGKDE